MAIQPTRKDEFMYKIRHKPTGRFILDSYGALSKTGRWFREEKQVFDWFVNLMQELAYANKYDPKGEEGRAFGNPEDLEIVAYAPVESAVIEFDDLPSDIQEDAVGWFDEGTKMFPPAKSRNRISKVPEDEE